MPAKLFHIALILLLASTVLYSQPHDGTGALYPSSFSTIGTDWDQYTWDSFSLPDTAQVMGVRWRGGFDPAYNGSGGPVVEFTVQIHASIPGGSEPDVVSPPLAAYHTFGSANQAPAGTFGGIALYDYSFNFPALFTASAGVKYWVQIEAAQDGGQPDWNLASSGSGGSHFRRRAGINGDIVYETVPGETAFTLVGPVGPYAISGRVLDGVGNEVSGVTISDGAGDTAISDAGGNYTLFGLSAGAYTLTPALAGYSFAPPNRAVTITSASQTGLDFTATLLKYQVSGQVLDEALAPLAWVVISTNTNVKATTGPDGTYTLTGLLPGAYTLTPALAGYTFSPPSTQVQVTNANQTGVDFSAAQITYTIEGEVKVGSKGLPGVSMTAGSDHTYTDAFGRYMLAGLLPGPHTVTPSLAGYSFTPASQIVQITNTDLTGVNFSAAQYQFNISGQVLDDHLAPLAGVIVTTNTNVKATTGSNGIYTLTGLSAGPYTLTPALAGYAFIPPSLQVQVTSTSLTGKNFSAARHLHVFITALMK